MSLPTAEMDWKVNALEAQTSTMGNQGDMSHNAVYPMGGKPRQYLTFILFYMVKRDRNNGFQA